MLHHAVVARRYDNSIVTYYHSADLRTRNDNKLRYNLVPYQLCISIWCCVVHHIIFCTTLCRYLEISQRIPALHHLCSELLPFQPVAWKILYSFLSCTSIYNNTNSGVNNCTYKNKNNDKNQDTDKDKDHTYSGKHKDDSRGQRTKRF